MLGSKLNPSQSSIKEHKEGGQWFSASFKVENFLPGVIIGFIVGMLFDISKHPSKSLKKLGKSPRNQGLGSNAEELKMVLVVRQDLKMGSGKIASQCAHAATGMYAELMQSQQYLLRQWELCGQPKIVVTCKNQQEMNKLKDMAESIGLPTFVVADAGRTQVLSGSKTVLAIGPGRKALVDEVTGKQHLL